MNHDGSSPSTRDGSSPSTRRRSEVVKRSSTVLVVEDDPDIRDVLREMLEPEGYEVATAEHGEDALAWLRTHLAPCAILLDLMMPVMDGPTFLRALRAEGSLSDIPVVVLSAAGPDLLASTADDVMARLPKPIQPDAVLTELSRARSSR